MESKVIERKALILAALLVAVVGVARADDPPQAQAPEMVPSTVAPEPAPIPRTNVNSTVVGDAAVEPQDLHNAPISLDNDHGFQAGAPELVKETSRLDLSAQQKTKIHDAIDNADAGAAALIKRENVVREMLAATTPDDPLYAKLKSEQGSAEARWNDNREGLRHTVAALLTPAQREKFGQSQTRQ